MERQRIEIFPGHWIEVTPKIRNMAGLRRHDRILAKFTDVPKVVEKAVTSKVVKYPQLIKEEAVQIWLKDGMEAAIKATGVNRHTIEMERRKQNIRAGLTKTRAKGFTYTLEQKQACVRLALQLIQSKEMVTRTQRAFNGKIVTVRNFKWHPQSAFKEAGKRLGLNGSAVHFQWSIGAIPMPQPSTQQPSGL